MALPFQDRPPAIASATAPLSPLPPPLQLEEAKVPMKQLKHNPSKVQPITPALQALLSKDAELKVRGSSPAGQVPAPSPQIPLLRQPTLPLTHSFPAGLPGCYL